MATQVATQPEIDFVFGALDWKHEGFPTNYDGTVEIEVEASDLLDLIWIDHHNAERVDIFLTPLYDGDEVVWDRIPQRLLGTYRISAEGARSFDVWKQIECQ